MTRGEMDSDEMCLPVELSDQAWQAESGGLIQHSNVYDGNGEYELPIARHYVPQYWRS